MAMKLLSILIVLAVSSPQPIPAALVSPAYAVKPARIFGVKCDGVTDDTAALQKALDRIDPNQALQLPAGACVTSRTLSLRGKHDVMIFGAGADSSIIRATDPLHSAFVVSNGSAVSLKGFQIYSPDSAVRSTDAAARGFYVETSSHVSLDGVKVRHTAGAGILFYVVTDSKIINSDVVDNLSDAFHVTGGSRDILVQFNRARGSGDDCFASIGYGARLNQGIRFLDNSCSGNAASGVSFEGTIGGQAYRNQLVRTGVSGIRIASQKSYNTGPVRHIDLKENVLTQVKTRGDVDHAAIMIFTSLADVDDITLTNTTVIDPRASTCLRARNFVPGKATLAHLSIDGLNCRGALDKVRQCIDNSRGASGLAVVGSRLNATSCEARPGF